MPGVRLDRYDEGRRRDGRDRRRERRACRRGARELGARNPEIGTTWTSLRTRLGRIELLRETDAVGGFEAWRARAQLVELGDRVQVLVGHPDDLLRSKEAADRLKDREQLPGIRQDFIAARLLDASEVRGPVAAAQAPAPAHLVALLGPRPAGDVTAKLSDTTADTLQRYRARYAIEEHDALGPTPQAGSSRWAERRQVERAVQRTRLIIQRDGPELQAPDVELSIRD